MLQTNQYRVVLGTFTAAESEFRGTSCSSLCTRKSSACAYHAKANLI